MQMPHWLFSDPHSMNVAGAVHLFPIGAPETQKAASRLVYFLAKPHPSIGILRGEIGDADIYLDLKA
jgi:hypothetical protein